MRESTETKIIKFIKVKKTCTISSVAKYLDKDENKILPILRRLKNSGRIHLTKSKVGIIRYPKTLMEIEEYLSDDRSDKAIDLIIDKLKKSEDAVPDFWQEVFNHFFSSDLENEGVMQCCANAFILGTLFEKHKRELLKFHS